MSVFSNVMFVHLIFCQGVTSFAVSTQPSRGTEWKGGEAGVSSILLGLKNPKFV